MVLEAGEVRRRHLGVELSSSVQECEESEHARHRHGLVVGAPTRLTSLLVEPNGDVEVGPAGRARLRHELRPPPCGDVGGAEHEAHGETAMVVGLTVSLAREGARLGQDLGQPKGQGIERVGMVVHGARHCSRRAA